MDWYYVVLEDDSNMNIEGMDKNDVIQKVKKKTDIPIKKVNKINQITGKLI